MTSEDLRYNMDVGPRARKWIVDEDYYTHVDRISGFAFIDTPRGCKRTRVVPTDLGEPLRYDGRIPIFRGDI